MTKKCWICGEDIIESIQNTNETDRFYGDLHLTTISKPYATNHRWRGAVWICQDCMLEKIGVDHNGKNLN